MINNFTEKDAKANFARDTKKNAWLCGAGPTWVCPQRDPYDYYVLLDEESKILSSSKDESELVAKKGQTIEKRSYEGCPRWHNSETSEQDDVFGF